VFRQLTFRDRHQVDSPGDELLIDPRRLPLPMVNLDLRIMGVVRWMNALGRASCDGHGVRTPHVQLASYPTPQQKYLSRCARRKACPYACKAEPSAGRWISSSPILMELAERLYSGAVPPTRR